MVTDPGYVADVGPRAAAGVKEPAEQLAEAQLALAVHEHVHPGGLGEHGLLLVRDVITADHDLAGGPALLDPAGQLER